MKRSLLAPLLATAAVFIASCDRTATVARPPTATPDTASETDDPTRLAAADQAALIKEIDELKIREATLRLQIQQDELAWQKADFEREKAGFDREKAALTEKESTSPTRKPAATAEKPENKPARAPRTATTGDRDYQMFYEGLNPHGRWMETREYGFVWQPFAVRDLNWRPYALGRWADSDQGWTWMSDEPFGWATYHYGRWALLQNHGWIWVPGDTWAPSWVAWRSNDDVVGWTPLPPETVYDEDVDYGPSIDDDYGLSPDSYTFVHVQSFNEPVISHCRPVSENQLFFSATVGVTRIVIRTDKVVCNGPDRRWINRHIAQPMTRHRLHRNREWQEEFDYRPHIENDELTCYAPRVRNAWNDGLRPSRVQATLERAAPVRRQESFRQELETTYRQERAARRERATTELEKEPVRRLAARHQELETIRGQREQRTERIEPATPTKRAEPAEPTPTVDSESKPTTPSTETTAPTPPPPATTQPPVDNPQERPKRPERIEPATPAKPAAPAEPVPTVESESKPAEQAAEINAQRQRQAIEQQRAAQQKERAERAESVRRTQDEQAAKRTEQTEQAAERTEQAAEIQVQRQRQALEQQQRAAEQKERAERAEASRRAQAEQAAERTEQAEQAAEIQAQRQRQAIEQQQRAAEQKERAERAEANRRAQAEQAEQAKKAAEQ